MMNEMPNAWVTRPFGDLNKFYGPNIDPASYPSEKFELYSIPVFPTGKPEQPLGGDVGSTKQMVEHNDVLISKINPRINRVWQVGPSIGLRQIASSEWIGFRCPQMDSRFFRYYFTSPVFRGLLCSDVTGVGGSLTRAQPKRVANFPVPVAPVSEQKRIADKLDIVLTRVDAVNERLARVAPILKRFRQSVLAAATSGRLTADWRDLNHTTTAQAKGQLDTITKARLQRMKKVKEAVERTKTEEFDIPQSWLWTSLDALTAKIVDGTHHTPTYVSEGVPFVSVKDIRDGVIDFSNTKFIAEEEHCELSKRCPVERGDLLITKSGTIGRTAIVRTDTPFSLFVSVALLKPASSEVNMRFIDLVLQHWIGSIDVSSRIVGSTIKNLHLVDMKVLGIPFPCLEEQTEIVRRVETLFAFSDRLEARLQAAQTAADRLTPSLLAKAFRGELVPQDPNDEPASELLKRLASSTTTVSKSGRRSKAAH